MKYTVATNWDNKFIDHIKEFPEIKEVYGKLAKDFVGGGRPSIVLPEVNREKVAQHVQKIHENGIEFNYLLNALCMGNKEFTRKGQKKLHEILNWLEEINVDRITVGTPYLLEFIKHNYPNFKISSSVNAFIKNIETAKYWEKLGADTITLHACMINRNFKRLKAIRKNVNCNLQLIANNGCIYYCPNYHYHALVDAHASQSGHKNKGFIIDYYYISCRLKRLEDPKYLIQADWIRPEDVNIYENLGIDSLKIVDRSMPTYRLKNITTAYIEREYRGNLLDLLATFHGSSVNYSIKRKLKALKYLFRPFTFNIFKLRKVAKLANKIEVEVNNKKLDNFLEYILENDNCDYIACEDCNYCKNVADEVVEMSASQKKLIKEYEDILSDISSGNFFSYNIFDKE